MALTRSLRENLLRSDGGSLAVESDADAYRICRRIAFGHYENFPVASLVLGRLRDDVAAIYAFARLADDIADELPAAVEQKLRLLEELDTWLQTPPRSHPIARALARTIARCHLPLGPIRRLLAAFRYDAAHVPFSDEAALRAYCQRSAAPIGELLLRLVGEWNQETAPSSDAFCAGLQVLNFWQDVWEDSKRGRWTFPLQWLPPAVDKPSQHVLLDSSICQMVMAQYDRLVGELLPQGKELRRRLRSRRLRLQVGATWESACIVWNGCRRRGVRQSPRPRLRWWNVPRIVLATLIG